MLSYIQSFALSNTSCRFSCSNFADGLAFFLVSETMKISRKRIQLLSSPGGDAPLSEVIAVLFGAKAEKGTLLRIVETLPDADAQAIYGLKGSDTNIEIFESIRCCFEL